MHRPTLFVGLALWVIGCNSKSTSTEAGQAPGAAPKSATTTEAASTKGRMATSQLRGRLISAGYGGVGPATPAPYPDVWIALFVDIESGAKLRGVAVGEVELLDAGGNVVARAKPPWDLRRDFADAARREKMDFGEDGTVPFDGEAESGQPLRLRVYAPLDTRNESLKAVPVRFRARVRAMNDPGVVIEGPLRGPWSTA